MEYISDMNNAITRAVDEYFAHLDANSLDEDRASASTVADDAAPGDNATLLQWAVQDPTLALEDVEWFSTGDAMTVLRLALRKRILNAIDDEAARRETVEDSDEDSEEEAATNDLIGVIWPLLDQGTSRGDVQALVNNVVDAWEKVPEEASNK